MSSFQCPMHRCNKRFTRTNDVKRHMNGQHLFCYRYLCPFCGHTDWQKGGIKTHARRCADGRPIPNIVREENAMARLLQLWQPGTRPPYYRGRDAELPAGNHYVLVSPHDGNDVFTRSLNSSDFNPPLQPLPLQPIDHLQAAASAYRSSSASPNVTPDGPSQISLPVVPDYGVGESLHIPRENYFNAPSDHSPTSSTSHSPILRDAALLSGLDAGTTSLANAAYQAFSSPTDVMGQQPFQHVQPNYYYHPSAGQFGFPPLFVDSSAMSSAMPTFEDQFTFQQQFIANEASSVLSSDAQIYAHGGLQAADATHNTIDLNIDFVEDDGSYMAFQQTSLTATAPLEQEVAFNQTLSNNFGPPSALNNYDWLSPPFDMPRA